MFRLVKPSVLDRSGIVYASKIHRHFKRHICYKKCRRDYIPYRHGWYRRKGDDLQGSGHPNFYMEQYYVGQIEVITDLDDITFHLYEENYS